MYKLPCATLEESKMLDLLGLKSTRAGLKILDYITLVLNLDHWEFSPTLAYECRILHQSGHKIPVHCAAEVTYIANLITRNKSFVLDDEYGKELECKEEKEVEEEDSDEPLDEQEAHENAVERFLSSEDNVNVVIYAPPNSGKTTLVEQLESSFHSLEVEDTDHIEDWKSVPSIIVTNDIRFLKHAGRSIGILPSRSKFHERCKSRGLNPKPHWYTDVENGLRFAHRCRIIESDSYLTDILELSSLSNHTKTSWFRKILK